MKVDQELLLKKITEVVESQVRPSLNMDGGDISIVSLDNNVLTVKLHGACSCCPRAYETLKHGVERIIKQFVSEDIEVTAA